MAIEKELNKTFGEGGTLTEFMEYVGYLDNEINNLAKEMVLRWAGTRKRSNNEVIYYAYSKEKREDPEIKSKFNSYTLEDIPKGVTLYYVPSKLKVDAKYLFKGDGTFYKGISNSSGYYGDYLKMIGNDNYNPEPFRKTISEGEELVMKNYNASVYVWCRSLGQIINISDFLTNLSTTVEGENNSFDFGLAPITNRELSKFSPDKSLNYSSINDLTFFYRHFRMNDIVFIKFEKLLGQDKRKDDFIIGNSSIPSNFYDFIGFVDIVSQSKSNIPLDVSISVSGRGLNKVFSDDSAYFYPRILMQGANKNFIPTDLVNGEDKWAKRALIGLDDTKGYGQYDMFMFTGWRAVSDLVLFIITQTSNLELCDSSIFEGYKSSIPIEGGNPTDRLPYLLSDSVEDKTSVNSDEISNQNIEREEKKALGIMPEDDGDVIQVLKGIWQITDVKIDDRVKDKGITANFFVNPEGSLSSMMDRICQYPFVEWYTDTYYDKVSVIVRQPPFIREDILDCLGDKESNTVEIKKSDVISENLSWETTYYSSYKIDALSNFPGGNLAKEGTQVPIVYSPTIANIYGNKMMALSSPYLPLSSNGGRMVEQDIKPYYKIAWEHLRWAIEANCYLPFTERGSYTINGDRRIKARTWIRLPEGKIGYVTSVTNEISFFSKPDRYTVVNVERVMYEDLVKGKPLNKLSEEESFSAKLNTKNTGGQKTNHWITGQEVDNYVELKNRELDAGSIEISASRLVNYWSIYKLATLEQTFMSHYVNGDGDTTATVQSTNTSPQFGLNKEIFEKFLKGIQF